MSDEYQPLPHYQPPQSQAVRMANSDEQKPLMKLLGKMLAPKTAKLPRMKGKISPQSIKVSHKKKTNQVIYY